MVSSHRCNAGEKDKIKKYPTNGNNLTSGVGFYVKIYVPYPDALGDDGDVIFMVLKHKSESGN